MCRVTSRRFDNDVAAEDLRGPARGRDQRGENVDRRCLARAVVAEESEDLALLDHQIDAPEHQLAIVAALQAAHLDGVVSHGSSDPSPVAAAIATSAPSVRGDDCEDAEGT